MKKIKIIVSLCLLIFLQSTSVAQPASWQPRGVGGGGALFYPRINPGNENEFYITSDMGEFFHSADFGKSYSQLSSTNLSSPYTNRTAGSSYCFTKNANIAYALLANGNQTYGCRTFDGGKTWDSLPGLNQTGWFDDSYDVLYADYNHPGRIVFGTLYTHLWFSQDSGATFKQIASVSSDSGCVVGGVFFDGDNIYIGTNAGIVYSTDGGDNFNGSR